MLTLAGEPADQALKDATDILAFETTLAKASMPVTERRDPAKVYHLETTAAFESSLPGLNFVEFEDAVHSPHVTELNVANPAFFPAMQNAVKDTEMRVLKAYMRYHLLTTVAGRLPKRFDDENFDFYARTLRGQKEQAARWKRCSNSVNVSLGEALGEVYVKQYFAGDSKAKMLEMVHDIENAMDQDLDQITWMSDATKVRAKEKLHLVANKIGYPEKFRDYSKLIVKRDDAVGNQLRADAFENDRELDKIGKPVDHTEWGMTPPTVNAYYDPSMNDINFPAGILQPAFYDPKADLATNYGHIGVVIGHELTHGFDDQGRQFNGKGNLDDWWTPQDAKNYEAKSDCLANEYSADNGGLLLAYMAYLERAKKDHIDIDKKIDGFTGPQRFYIAYAQNWCENDNPENVRNQVLTNPHSPGHFRANGAIVNQPGFGPAFGCKVGTPMVPANSCRIW
jgi:putative endopeptidase